MKEKVKLFFKGILIGIASILPGISGGTLAVTLGIYEKTIKMTSNFFKDIKKSLEYLLPIVFGVVIAALLFSGVLATSLEKYNTQTTLFILGLLLGGIPALLNKVSKKTLNAKNIFIFVCSFILIMAFVLLHAKETAVTFSELVFIDYIKLFLVGIIAAATFVVPGISGSLVLMIIGYYKPILETVSSLLKFKEFGGHLLVLIFFGLGILFGIMMMSKLINFLLKKYPVQTYYAIFGIILASIIGVILPLKGSDLMGVVVGLVLLLGGAFVTMRLGE